MTEWKRVLFDPKRLFLLLLMTLVCAGLLVLSFVDELGPRGLPIMRSANVYAEDLAQRWKDADLEELSGLVNGELEKLNEFDYWYGGYIWYESPFETEEEAYASIADLPKLAQAARSGDIIEYYRIWSAYYDVLTTMSEEADYLSGYADYLDGIQKQAQLQSQTSLFGKPGSFSRRNLAKTAEEFDSLRGVEVAFGSNRGLEAWLSFDLGDYFHLIAMILFVFAFLEERKKGLWPLIRTTRGGRARLGMTRVGLLFIASLAATVLFNAIPLAVSLAINGGWDGLGRSLQSLESFRTCTLRITIGQWLGRYFLFKVLSGVLIGLFLWCVLGFISNIQFSLSVLGTVLAGEYVLYELLPVQSGLNVFKYFNVFTFVHTFTRYTQYLNVDLFGFPVGIRELTGATLAVLGLGLAVLAVLIQRDRRPEGNRDILSRVSLVINRALDFFRGRFSIGIWETYKFGVFQYGIIILLVVLFATSRLTFLSYNTSSEDRWYLAYVRDMEGPIDDSTETYLAHAWESIPANSEDTGSLTSALSKVERRVTQLRERAGERGYAPWIVDESDYSMIYGPDSVDLQRLNAAAAIILTAFCCASLAAFERQSGVTPMLRAVKRGRKGLLWRKLLLTGALSVFVWAAVYAREYKTLIDWFKPQTFAAPVQNIDALANFPIVVTMGQYLAILYGARLLMLLGVGFTALLISHCTPNVQTAYLASAGILGIPALMTVLGVDIFKWISPIVPVASAELMWSLGSGSLVYALPWLAWLAICASALWLCRRRWVNGR